MNAAIDPAWAEPIAGDLAKRSYSEPHWESKQGAVVAYERVTLYGVPIIQRRGSSSRGSTCRTRASCSSATPSSRATGTRSRRSTSRTGPSAQRSSSSRSARAAATSCSTTRPCSTSTRSASRPRSRARATSRAGGRRRARDPRPAHDDRSGPPARGCRRARRERVPRAVAPGRPDPLALATASNRAAEDDGVTVAGAARAAARDATRRLRLAGRRACATSS